MGRESQHRRRYKAGAVRVLGVHFAVAYALYWYGPTGGPENVTEVCLIMCSMCIGASFYIILVGMISSNLVEKDTGLAKRKDHPALLELQKKQRASLLIREKSMFATPRIRS